MNKIVILLLLVCLLLSCTKQSDNELLLKAYKKQDYAKCLKILQNGADGRINYSKKDYPLLFDICWKYLNSAEKLPGIENLLDFYLKNRKAAFEDSIEGTYPYEIKEHINPKQTVGSYLSRFATIELLQRIAQENININSPDEYIGAYSLPAIYDLASKDGWDDKNDIISGSYFHDWVIKIEEKKVRIDLLLDAGANVTLIDNIFGSATIFTMFHWYPFEEDYIETLDKMIEKGADLFQGTSCIYSGVGEFALYSNTEAKLEYVISRGLHVTKEDLDEFADTWFYNMRDNKVTKMEMQRLEKIKRILEEDAKLIIVPRGSGYELVKK